MRSIIRRLEAILWPRALQCLCCPECTDGQLLCPSCRAELRSLRLEAHRGSHHSVWAYAGCAKRLVTGLKHECIADCAAVMGRGMAEAVKRLELPADTVMTWVTMPENRRRVRGIDHGRLLCETIAGYAGMPAEQLLVRQGRIHTQRGLNREKRLSNLQGSFAAAKELQGTVLLIDDVMTTGATADACSAVLYEAGAAQVVVLTATRVLRRPEKKKRG